MEVFYPYIITAIIGFITFFLKRTMSRVDKSESTIHDIKLEYVTTIEHEKDMEKVDRNITKIREDYTPKSEFKEVVSEFRQEMKDAQKQFLTKEDFYREQNKMEKKIDKIIDLLIKEGK